MAISRIVLVGHCGPDSWALRAMLDRVAPGVAVAGAGGQSELDACCTADVLLLVNRVPAGEFGGVSGVELIRRMRQHATPPAMMLVSDYPEAQAEAVAAGASPGFGKSQLHDEQVASRIRAAMGA